MARTSGKSSNQRRRSNTRRGSTSKTGGGKGGGQRRPAKSSGARRKRRSSQPALSFRALAGIWFAAGVALGLLILVPIYFASGPESGQAGDSRRSASGDTPDYRFYDILPHTRVEPPRPEAEEGDGQADTRAPGEEAGSASEPQRPRGPADTEVPPVPEEGRFFLQVASFQDRPDAERLKARLALRGLRAHVVSAEVPGKGTWYRVRLGPFSEAQRLRDVEGQLREAGIRPLRIRAGG